MVCVSNAPNTSPPTVIARAGAAAKAITATAARTAIRILLITRTSLVESGTYAPRERGGIEHRCMRPCKAIGASIEGLEGFRERRSRGVANDDDGAILCEFNHQQA